MNTTLEEAQSVLWKDLVEAMKPKLDAMQQDLLNKGQCFAKITDKGIQFIPCEAVYIKEDKPTKKIIDLSVLIESGIDCEFSDDVHASAIAKLETITTSHTGEPYYINDKGLYWGRCTPRMNHKHAWQGGDCPLPEGFRVKIWRRNGEEGDAGDAFHLILRWSNEKWESDIIAFEVLGVADGYVMPWEPDNE